MASFDLTYELSPSLAQKAAQRYIWQRAGWFLVLNVVALLSCIALLLSGNRDWYVFVLFSVAGVYLSAWTRSYIKMSSRTRELADRRMAIHVDDDGIEAQFAHIQTKVEWKAKLHVWKSRDLWMLTAIDQRLFLFIPTTELSDEAKAFIESKVIENAGTIT